MRGVKRIRPLICHPGRWHHATTSRSNGLGLLALALACGGGLVLARCELSRDQGSLDRALAAVTALTRTAVAVSDSIGVPSILSVKIIEAVEGVFRDVVALSRDAAYERLQKALLLIDFARIHTELGSSELARTRTSEADSGRRRGRLVVPPSRRRNCTSGWAWCMSSPPTSPSCTAREAPDVAGAFLRRNLAHCKVSHPVRSPPHSNGEVT
jgi:hypothetical protein